MKRRRFPLSLAILLPVLLLLTMGLAGIYLGAYFVIESSSRDAALRSDEEDLNTLNDVYATNNYALLGYAVTPLIKVYEDNKPEGQFVPGSPEETAYYAKITTAASTQQYGFAEAPMERYVTGFIGVFYEDVATNRFVLVCSSNKESEGRYSYTSLKLGAIIDKPSFAVETGFYGEIINDQNMGDMFTSGIYMAEVKHPTGAVPGGPYRVWLMRETSMKEVYVLTPLFTRSFAIVSVATLAVLGAAVYLLIYFLVVRPTRKLAGQGNEYVRSLEKGELKEIFHKREKGVRNELSDLNDSLYVTQQSIAEYAQKVRDSAAYEERINADLALAERIQASMVPSEPLKGENFLIRGRMTPAREVGGDLYSYFRIDEDHVGFFIGDVSGKGVPAALFMAKAHALLRLSLRDLNIDETNRILAEDNAENFFVTAFAATLNIKTGELRYVNAGHEPVFLFHDGSYQPLEEEPNFLLGCIPDFKFAVQKKRLVPGDRLFLYTDGVSEAMDEQGNLFGKERIQGCLNDNAGLPSVDTFRAIIDALKKFCGNAPQADDECMVALDYANEETLSFDPTPEGLAQVAPFVDQVLEGKPVAFISQIQVIVDELCSNVVNYSGATEPVLLVLRDDGENIHGALVDQGKPFDPLTDKPEYNPDKPGGLGIIMAENLLDALAHRYVEQRNIIFFRKAYKTKD